MLEGLYSDFVRSTFDLAVDSPESSGELGDVLVFPHPKDHKVGVRLRDDPIGLEFFQEGDLELSLAGDRALGERAEPPQGEISQTGGKDSTVQEVVIPQTDILWM